MSSSPAFLQTCTLSGRTQLHGSKNFVASDPDVCEATPRSKPRRSVMKISSASFDAESRTSRWASTPMFRGALSQIGKSSFTPRTPAPELSDAARSVSVPQMDVSASANGNGAASGGGAVGLLKDAVLKQLSKIDDPDLRQDIVSAGFIKDLVIDAETGDVSFTLELTTPACPIKEQFKADAERLVGELPWVNAVRATLSSGPRASPFATQSKGLSKVSNIIAVSSCKGGVGKSTVAVNLAYTLARLGAKVGIFDADIYGPSLPVMISPEDTVVQYNKDNLIVPLEYKGVKAMSFGFVQKGGQAAVMRGPIVSNVLNQLLTTTEWGELDYLVVDMPPGTGDIQLTMCQLVNITAAVIITTPQKLSFVDVVKGIQMFDKVSVPSVAVVENMSYFLCEKCSEPHYPFGRGSREKLVQQFGFTNAFSMPIHSAVSDSSDVGIPYVLQEPDSLLSAEYLTLASSVVREISRLRFGGMMLRPTLKYTKEAHTLELEVPSSPPADADGVPAAAVKRETRVLDPATVRRKCRCAACIDEYTGEQILDPASVPDSVTPLGIQPTGNYAVSVQWSDGHSSLYPHKLLLSIEQKRVADAVAGPAS